MNSFILAGMLRCKLYTGANDRLEINKPQPSDRCECITIRCYFCTLPAFNISIYI